MNNVNSRRGKGDFLNEGHCVDWMSQGIAHPPFRDSVCGVKLSLDVDKAQLPNTRAAAEVKEAWGLQADEKEAIAIVEKESPSTALIFG